MKYKLEHRSPVGIDAQSVGEELERLAESNDGELLPASIVKSAKKKSSPMHNWFEWDDTKAAKAHRLAQASHLLRCIKVVYEDAGEPETVRAFINIRDEEEDAGYYTPLANVVADEALADNVRDQILSDLIAIKAKYKKFQNEKLRKIWKAIDEFISG